MANPTAGSPRLRRLYADLAAMMELAQASDLITFVPAGNPPDRYRVTYTCRGLYLPEGATEPLPLEQHIADFYLHLEYPRRPPQILWRTAVFHPNILSVDRGGAVCIGSWTPSESLADLVIRVGEMVQYRQYNPDDVLDPRAATWAEAQADALPVDDRPLAVYVV
jgi:ubiquitin-protein ligase